MSSDDPFGHLKHKLWPKEGMGVKLVVWIPTTKSQESTWFPFVEVACDISLKSSRQGLQLCFRPHLNWRSSHKVMGPQSCKSPHIGNFGTLIWDSQDKMSFGCGPRGEAQNIYYKGEDGGFPQVRVVVSFASSNLLVVSPNIKSVSWMH